MLQFVTASVADCSCAPHFPLAVYNSLKLRQATGTDLQVAELGQAASGLNEAAAGFGPAMANSEVGQAVLKLGANVGQAASSVGEAAAGVSLAVEEQEARLANAFSTQIQVSALKLGSSYLLCASMVGM